MSPTLHALAHYLPGFRRSHRRNLDKRIAKHLADAVPVPFVVTASHAGPYEDEAFLAGAQFGAAAYKATVLGYLPHSHFLVGLRPQLDLLAMTLGLGMTVFASDDPNLLCVEMFSHTA